MASGKPTDRRGKRMNAVRALSLALGISISILLVELAGGFVFRSAALVADALHVVTDILAVFFSLVALKLSDRGPTGSLTYGYHRIEVVSSLANGLSLFAIVGIIGYEAYGRLLAPIPIGVFGTVALASLALVLNLFAVRTLRMVQTDAHGHSDLNVASAGVHVLGDSLASLAVIVGAVAVFLTGETIVDPLVAIFIGLLVVRSAAKVTWQALSILLEGSPIEDMQEVSRSLRKVGGISDIHDLHIWRICSHLMIATMHTCLNEEGKKNPAGVTNELEGKLNTLGVQHATIQFEENCCVPSHRHE